MDDVLWGSPVPAYSAPKVGPVLVMASRSIVDWLPIVQRAETLVSPEPQVFAPNVTPSLMIVPRSIVLLDPAITCEIKPALCRACVFRYHIPRAQRKNVPGIIYRQGIYQHGEIE